ncbi:MAG: hypothetical protein ACRDTQ_15570 [Micromonosporaceae bacterium]
MSHAPAGSAGTCAPAAAVDAGAPIPFARLLAVETRKLFDTRSGMILSAVLVALTIAAITGRGVVAGPDFGLLIGTAGIGHGIVLPVLGILTVTNEWSHRTALVTYALEPRRGRVLAAKCLPPLLAAVLASGLAMAVAAPITAVTAELQQAPPNWDVSVWPLLGWTATNVLLVATGLAVGMLLLNAPAAIVLCMTTPILWALISKLGAAGEFSARWLDLNTNSAALSRGDLTGGDVAHLAASIGFWIVIPLVVGAARVRRKDVA